MNWDERAVKVANALYPDDTKSHENKRLGCMAGFNYGVGAALSHVSTDEAVERLANFLHNQDHGDSIDHHDAVCERDREGCDRRELYTEDARAVIDALIGEEP